MKYLNLLLAVSLFGSCTAQTHTIQAARFDENNDACSSIEIGLGFLKHYISLSEENPDDAYEWVLTYSQTSEKFKKAYQAYYDERDYIGADPILCAQDIPSNLYVADKQAEMIFVRDQNWEAYYNVIFVEDCKVTGVGEINIEELENYTPPSDAQVEERIKSIRKSYAKINKHLPEYELIEHTREGETTEGGLSRYYLKDNQFVKVEEEFYGEMGKRRTEYYDDDQGLCFVFDQISHYNVPMYMTEPSEEGMEVYDESKTRVEENRYYFDNDRLIKWIDKNHTAVDPYFMKFKYKYLESLGWSFKFQ